MGWSGPVRNDRLSLRWGCKINYKERIGEIMGELLLGLFIIIAASVLQGSFLVPMAYVKGWKWENSWAVFSILGMIVFNWILAFVSIPSLCQVYQAASFKMVAIPAVFGLLWGIGAVGFGLGIAAVGLALGYAIIMGLVLSLGAFIPMVALHPGDVLTLKGITIIIGVAVMLFGIALFGRAGMRKEKEQGEKAGEITKLSKASMKLGLIICIIGGVFSCFPNVGFSLSKPLIDLAIEYQAAPNWAGNSIWSILFTFGGLVNIVYCGYLFKKNKSFGEYKGEGFGRNLALMALVSLMWIGSFIIYGVGARMMGDWGTVIGWSVFIALSISIAGIWGIAQKEWDNTSRQTRKLMAVGIAILVLAIFIFAYSSMQ